MTESALDTSARVAPASATPHHLHGAARLEDWGVIRAAGPDAASFLQGQLTNDIAGLQAGQAALAGYCSAKGRLLASFVVWSPAQDEYLLACSADLLAATLKRLSMFVLRAKCRLSDASTDVVLWGLAGEASAGGPLAPWHVRAWGDKAQVVGLPPGAGVQRALLALPAGEVPPGLPTLLPADWRWLEVCSGVVRIVSATADQFVPQMVNFELVGGVNFKKGCYPGQEVVARSQYRGTLKRRALLLAMPADTQAQADAGQEVFHDSDPSQPAGMVALAGTGPSGEQMALVELKRALVETAGQFRLGAAAGPALALHPMPYELPSDAA